MQGVYHTFSCKGLRKGRPQFRTAGLKLEALPISLRTPKQWEGTHQESHSLLLISSTLLSSLIWSTASWLWQAKEKASRTAAQKILLLVFSFRQLIFFIIYSVLFYVKWSNFPSSPLTFLLMGRGQDVKNLKLPRKNSKPYNPQITHLPFYFLPICYHKPHLFSLAASLKNKNTALWCPWFWFQSQDLKWEWRRAY